LFAVHQEGGHTCIQVFFFRSGQNWGNRPYFPKHDRGVEIPEILDSFLAQFYDDRDPPKLVLISHEIPEHALLEQALSVKAERRVEVLMPQRGEKREVMAQAVMNARESLARRMAESATQLQLLEGVAKALGLDEAPRRIEVYDNSHIQGTSAVGAMIVAGPEGFIKNQYRKFNIKSTELTPGDDFGMMREVLTRRFKRLLKDQEEEEAQVEGDAPPVFDEKKDDDEREPGNAPDLVLIDGGQGQLSVACEVFAALGVTGVKLVAIAKGPDRDAGRERFSWRGGSRFSSSSSRRSCSICNGCAMRRTASPSARIGRSGRRRSRPHRWTRSRGLGRRANGPCSITLGRGGRSPRRACPTSNRSRGSARRWPARFTSIFTIRAEEYGRNWRFPFLRARLRVDAWATIFPIF